MNTTILPEDLRVFSPAGILSWLGLLLATVRLYLDFPFPTL